MTGDAPRQGTRLAGATGGVADEAWVYAARDYGEGQLAALVSLIALISASTSRCVITGQRGGGYQPGKFG